MIFVGGLAALPYAGIAQQPAPQPVVETIERPDFKIIEAALHVYFFSQKDFDAADLLSQPQVSKALDAVLLAGWDVSDRDAITARALPDESFLVKELSTPAGRKFMRNIAKQPGSYGRLDRLSTIAGGQQLIHDLIRQKNGDKFITYLATTAGGRSMGKIAANTRHGVDLNKPTGRIYTAADLLAALHESYMGKKKVANSNVR